MEKTKLLWGLTNLFYRNYSYFLHKKQLQQKKRIVFSIHTILNYTQHCQGDFFAENCKKKYLRNILKQLQNYNQKKSCQILKKLAKEI